MREQIDLTICFGTGPLDSDDKHLQQLRHYCQGQDWQSKFRKDQFCSSLDQSETVPHHGKIKQQSTMFNMNNLHNSVHKALISKYQTFV